MHTPAHSWAHTTWVRGGPFPPCSLLERVARPCCPAFSPCPAPQLFLWALGTNPKAPWCLSLSGFSFIPFSSSVFDLLPRGMSPIEFVCNSYWSGFAGRPEGPYFVFSSGDPWLYIEAPKDKSSDAGCLATQKARPLEKEGGPRFN